jgi:putative flippase GtrA
MSFLRFSAVGVGNTLLGLTLIFALMRFGGVQYIAANAVGYAVGTVVSFVLNRSWTFYHKGRVLSSAVRWGLVIAIAYAANVFIVILSHEYFGIDRYISQGLGVFAYTCLSYLGARFYAFSPRLNLAT